nr:methionyl-tRNA formyltransferase [uncultured Methanoregula sp.]
MRIIFAGNKERGISCLKSLISEKHEIVAVIAPKESPECGNSNLFAKTAKNLGLGVIQPDDINKPDIIEKLQSLSPDLIILAGYGQIVKEPFIKIAPLGCINLHGGKLPKYRGSSPMNWALINGVSEFTLTIIKVDCGVDTGDILHERTFPVSGNDTIADLQNLANIQFPEMLIEVVNHLQKGTIFSRKQDDALASYYPLRFPDDGLILWDQLTAQQVHNRIRALTDPYPGAFSFFKKRKVKLLKSSLTTNDYFGEPGRVYRKSETAILVCASDRCLWIETAVFEKDGTSAVDQIQRYDKFVTLGDLIIARSSEENQ